MGRQGGAWWEVMSRRWCPMGRQGGAWVAPGEMVGAARWRLVGGGRRGGGVWYIWWEVMIRRWGPMGQWCPMGSVVRAVPHRPGEKGGA